MVEHLRLGQHELGERQGAAGIAGQQGARRERGGGVDVDGHGSAPYDRGMAKKQKGSRTDAVRDAVDQAFKTQIPRERLSDLLDEIGNTAGRLRGAVDELRPATEAEIKELRGELAELRAEITALKSSVAALESKPAPRRAPAKPRARAAAKPAAAAAAKKPAAKPRARKPPAPKPSAPPAADS